MLAAVGLLASASAHDMAGVTPVSEIDGHPLTASPGPITQRIAALYEALKDAGAARGSPSSSHRAGR